MVWGPWVGEIAVLVWSWVWDFRLWIVVLELGSDKDLNRIERVNNRLG